MKRYTVQAGDTLGTIAKRFYGDAARYTEIVSANTIADPDQIEVGRELIIPNLGDTGKVVLTEDQLQEIMPRAKPENIEKYLAPLNNEMPGFGINTPLRAAHFIAQIAHESGSFRHNSENLNYSASALRRVFRKYFPTVEMAEAYARQPEKIANRVYAGRMGNGPEESGDGWKYRGRGLIQLTGHDNYTNCGQGIGLDLENQPDPVADDPFVSVKAVGWFWETNNLNRSADDDDVVKVTKIINGGTHGLKERKEFLERAKKRLFADIPEEIPLEPNVFTRMFNTIRSWWKRKESEEKKAPKV